MLKLTILTLSLLAVAGSAQARITVNASQTNALIDNGVQLNCLQHNGTSANPPRQNGLSAVSIELPGER